MNSSNTKQTHTAGPWEVGTATRGYEVCTVHGVTRQPTDDGMGQEWVYVYPPRVINGEWHWPDGDEQIANARLIAAAPDMLAALRWIADAAAADGNADIEREARAAIARAESTLPADRKE